MALHTLSMEYYQGHITLHVVLFSRAVHCNILQYCQQGNLLHVFLSNFGKAVIVFLCNQDLHLYNAAPVTSNIIALFLIKRNEHLPISVNK